MELIKGFAIILFIIGCVCIIIYFMTMTTNCDKKVIYKYIPKTLSENEEDPIFVSEIYSDMFSQPSVWIDSLYLDDKRKTALINKYFISQF